MTKDWHEKAMKQARKAEKEALRREREQRQSGLPDHDDVFGDEYGDPIEPEWGYTQP